MSHWHLLIIALKSSLLNNPGRIVNESGGGFRGGYPPWKGERGRCSGFLRRNRATSTDAFVCNAYIAHQEANDVNHTVSMLLDTVALYASFLKFSGRSHPVENNVIQVRHYFTGMPCLRSVRWLFDQMTCFVLNERIKERNTWGKLIASWIGLSWRADIGTVSPTLAGNPSTLKQIHRPCDFFSHCPR